MGAKGSSDSIVQANCIAQEWEVCNVSALEESHSLSSFMCGGMSWHIELEPCPDGKKGPPGVFLCCDYRGKRVACKVKFSFIYINKKDPAKNYKRGFTKAFDDKTSTGDGWGFGAPAAYPHTEGMLLDDTLLLHTRLKIAKITQPDEALDMDLMEESEQLLSGILLKAINDNAWKPDVTLSLGEKKLPAHRYLLAEHPSVLKAMLLGIDKTEGGDSNELEIKDIEPEDMELILKYIYNTLETIPDQRVELLFLATQRLEMDKLKRRCIIQLAQNLGLDTFVETAMLAERLEHEHLMDVCIQFALSGENRSAIAKQKHFKRLMQEAPTFALRLMQMSLEKGAPKKRQMPKEADGEDKRQKEK